MSNNLKILFLILAFLLFAVTAGAVLQYADDFERTDSNPLNGSWNNYCFNGCGALLELYQGDVINGNVGDTYSIFTAFTATPNQESEIVIYFSACTSDYQCWLGPLVRGDGADNMYGVLLFSHPGYSEVDLFLDDGSITTLASDNVTQWIDDDVAKLSVVGDELTLYRNGSVFLTVPPDATLATGQPGIYINVIETAWDSLARIKSFSAGNIGSVVTTRRRAVVVQ
jgi:hypothetical protein